MFAQIPFLRGLPGEALAAIAGAIGSGLLLAKRLLNGKAPRNDLVTKADFYAEMLATRERLNQTHLALLDKLEVNHRELLAALERHAGRLSALESGFARVDERTRGIS